MSAVVLPPVTRVDAPGPSASPAAPAALEFRYTQTHGFVAPLQQLGGSRLISTCLANKLLVARAAGRTLDAGALFRQADGDGRGRPSASTPRPASITPTWPSRWPKPWPPGTPTGAS